VRGFRGQGVAAGPPAPPPHPSGNFVAAASASLESPALRAAITLLLLLAHAAAETPDEAADRVATAVASGDTETLKSLAAREQPDPWLVAEALCARDAQEAARAFATLAPKPDGAALPAYVETATPDPAVRAALAAATEALDREKQPQRALDLLKDVETNDPVGAIRILLVRGYALGRIDRFEDSQKVFEDLAVRARELGWLSIESRGLKVAGYCAAYRSDLDGAARNWQARVDLDTKRGRAKDVASTVGDLGVIAQRQGRLPEARAYQERALAAARELGDHALELNTMNSLASVLQDLGEHREALAIFEQVLAMYRAREDKEGVAKVTEGIGNLRFRMGEHREAERLLREALALREALGDPAEIAGVQGNLALVLKSLGEYDNALELAAKSMAFAESKGDRRSVAIALELMGSVRRTLGDYDDAVRLYERAMALSRDVGDRQGVSSGLTSLALVRMERGDLAGALAMHQESLAINRAAGAKRTIAVSLTNIGLVQWRLGRYRDAIAAHEESLRIHEEIGDKIGEAISLANLAGLHAALGDPDRAIALYRRALAGAEAAGEKESIVAILDNLAMAESARGDLDAALAGYEKALALAERLGMRDSVAYTLGRIGLAHMKKGDPSTAVTFLERGRAIEEGLGLRRKLIGTLGNLAEARLALGELDEALELRRQALAIAEEIGADEPLARQEWGLAKTYLAAGDAATALAYARRAARRVPDMLAGLGDVQGAAARTEWVGVYEVGTSAAVELGDAAATCEFIEGARGGAMLESLGGRDAIKSAKLPASLRDLEASARARLAVARRSHDDALRSGDRDAIRQRRGEMDEAAVRVEDAVDRIQREAKQVGQVLYPKPRSLANIQSALGEGDTLVLFDLLYEQAIAFVVRRDDARIVALGERAAVEAACQGLEGIDPRRDAGAALERAREALVAPLALGKETRRVLVSPDAAIHAVPFAALLPDREVAYVPSGTTFRILGEEKAAPGRDVLALGDPAYAAHPRLPATRQEAGAVGNVRLLGADATPAAFASALGKRPRWRAVHLACHGRFDPRRPLLSALILAPSEGSDGMLSTADIFGLSIPADLVTLSACETARGKSYEGEGVVGLVRAIMLAGAPRVLVSLWKVDDEASRALMVKFYDLWRTRPAAAALREAQQSVASKEEWRHPYYWAAWQLWGIPD
jgi:tetratricopeptide (TPR) repeat protein